MKHADFVHLHNHSHDWLLAWARLRLAISGLMLAGLIICHPEVNVRAGVCDSLFTECAVLGTFPVDDTIERMFVKENTIAVMTRKGHSTTISAWDLSGKELFRIFRADTTTFEWGYHPDILYLRAASDDGSTFATSVIADGQTLDRSGQTLSHFPFPWGLYLSPKGHYAYSSPSTSSCESIEFKLFSTGSLPLLSGSSHIGSFAICLSDSLIAVNSTGCRGFYELPSCRRRAELADMRLAQWEDDQVYAVAAPDGSCIAAIGTEAAYVISANGTILWQSDKGSRAGCFDSDAQWLFLLTEHEYDEALECHSLPDTTVSLVFAPFPIDLGDWWEMSITEHLSGLIQGRILLCRGLGRLQSKIAIIDLPEGRLIDAADFKADYYAVPGAPTRFVRSGFRDNGLSYVELIVISREKSNSQ